jgi:hypothetical protein
MFMAVPSLEMMVDRVDVEAVDVKRVAHQSAEQSGQAPLRSAAGMVHVGRVAEPGWQQTLRRTRAHEACVNVFLAFGSWHVNVPKRRLAMIRRRRRKAGLSTQMKVDARE